MSYQVYWVKTNGCGILTERILLLAEVATEQEAIDWITNNTHYPRGGSREYRGEYDSYAVYSTPDSEKICAKYLHLRKKGSIWPPQLKQQILPLK